MTEHPEHVPTFTPWQEEMIDRFLSGERFIICGGRRAGRRMVANEVAFRSALNAGYDGEDDE